VHAFVFNNSGVLSPKCCERLLHAGRECHNSVTNSILSEEEFSREETKEILVRQDEAWNLCQSREHIGTSRPANATIVQPLPGCASKITSACGPKIYAFVFHKPDVLSKECCGRLLNAGKKCYDSITNFVLIEEDFIFTGKEMEIVERHIEVWNLCNKNGHIDSESPIS